MSKKRCCVDLIGDVHGRYNDYVKACKEAQRSVQVGDLVGLYHGYQVFETAGLDPSLHQFFGGNHDNYDLIDECPHNLGDYGHFEVDGVGVVFWVRGAFSIDHKTRHEFPRSFLAEDGNTYIAPKDFWPDKEQLTVRECMACLDAYEKVKPDVILSHECPFFFLDEVTNPWVTTRFGYDHNLIQTNTNLLLDAMYEYHRPRYHLFGHYHHWKAKKVDGTTLVCIPIMGAVDFYEDRVVPVNIGNDKYSSEITSVVLD